MTELVELQHWRCPWCGDYLPDSPRGTAIDHIIPRVYGGPHRRWNLQLLHQECNSAKGKKITAGALDLAGAHGVTISMDIGQYRAGVRRRAAIYAVRATRQLDSLARDRALAAARNLTVFFPEARVRSVIRAAAEGRGQAEARRLGAASPSRREPHGKTTTPITPGQPLRQTPPHPSAESGVDRGSDPGVEVEARIGSYARSSQCRIDPSNGQSPLV
jgi:hypothetical protein